ncbi:MAG: recombinase family protein [Firmicutes bacterium]|nr:recombinase family protein [Bacillota bacterium]
MKKKYELPNPLRVAVYTRFGTDPQGTQEGEPVRLYSGKESLLAAGRAGQINQLLVESFTSLGRNSIESLGLLRNLQGAGVTVHLLKEGRVV